MNQGWSAYSIDLRQHAVRRHAGEAHAVLLEPALVGGVDLVAVAVALGDFGRAVDLRDLAAALRAPPDRRRAASCRRDRRSPARFSSSLPLSHSVIRPTTGSGVGPNSVEFASSMPAEIARRLDHRHLHAEADAEIRHVALARELRRADLAFRAALAEAARHQDAVDVLEERRGILLLEHLGLDPVEIDLHLVGDAAVRERLDQRFVGVLHAGVLADDRDRDLAFRIADALVDRAASASGRARRRHRCRRPPALRCRALRPNRLPAPRRCCRRRAPRSPRFRAHCRTARACARSSFGIGRSVRHSRMSGWMPIERSSFTECCVGLVFSSPALGM